MLTGHREDEDQVSWTKGYLDHTDTLVQVVGAAGERRLVEVDDVTSQRHPLSSPIYPFTEECQDEIRW
jgi:hypothetical protein